MNLFETTSHSHYSGGNLDNFACDITLSTSSGNYSTQLNFPKIYHGRSLLTCVRHCITMTGRVTSIHAKNSVTGDGFNFPFIHSFLRNISTNNYEFIYVARKNRSKIHFFRIKQVCPHGYIWFSKTKSIGLKNSDESKINIYPDVFEHIVGIKFVNIFSGNF